MNKLLIIMAVQLAMALPTAKTNAQDPLLARNHRHTVVLPIALLQNLSTSSPNDPGDVSNEVIKKFTKQYGNCTSATWTKDNMGFVVWFTSNGIQNRVFLTKHGNYQGSIRYYTEKDLDAAIRHQIKSMYYDFAITAVQEVQYGSETVYLVTIADATTLKVLRVKANQLDVWEEHQKS